MGGEQDTKALQGMLSGTGGPLSTDAPLDKNKLQSIGASAARVLRLMVYKQIQIWSL